MGRTLPKNARGSKWRQRRRQKRGSDEKRRGRAIARPRREDLGAECRGAAAADRAVGSHRLEAGGALARVLLARLVVASRCGERRWSRHIRERRQVRRTG